MVSYFLDLRYIGEILSNLFETEIVYILKNGFDRLHGMKFIVK